MEEICVGLLLADLASTSTPYMNDRILEYISRSFFILSSGST